MLILGIETSCDETAVALVEAKAGHFIIHRNLISSQIKIHRRYGGVVPEVAARNHVEKILPLLQKILPPLSPLLQKEGKIDVIAVTAGPGLVTSLLVGVETARTLAYLWKKPLVAINHLEGHIYANWLPSSCHSGLEPESRNQRLLDSRSPMPLGDKLRGDDKQKPPISNFQFPNQFPISNFKFPILCLIVSGGHTELILMKGHLKYRLIGQTRDDAVGECFDKVGKMLGLPYPGGPEVANSAARGNPTAISFPRPMIDSPDFDFSFSGLKTAVLYYLHDFARERKRPKQSRPIYGEDHFAPIKSGLAMSSDALADTCASFQQAAVDVLVAKTIRAAQKFQVKTIMLGGGVAANTTLRKQLEESLQKSSLNLKYRVPDTQYCGDNAAMIAAAGYWHAIKKDFIPWPKLKVKPNWELTD